MNLYKEIEDFVWGFDYSQYSKYEDIYSNIMYYFETEYPEFYETIESEVFDFDIEVSGEMISSTYYSVTYIKFDLTEIENKFRIFSPELFI